VYEDFEKVIAKDKSDLYSKINEGDVDWFSEYDEPDEISHSQDPENRRYYNDYRFTDTFSSIPPPNLLTLPEQVVPIIQPAPIQSTQTPSVIKLDLAASYSEHTQQLSKHTTDPSTSAFLSLPISQKSILPYPQSPLAGK
jgi:hypothetical protein